MVESHFLVLLGVEKPQKYILKVQIDADCFTGWLPLG